MKQGYSFSLYRRSYERFNLDASANLIVDKGIDRPSILKDLSSRGAGVVSNWPLKVDEKVEIVIMASIFNKPVYRKAKVVWCKKIYQNLWQAGLDFGLDNRIELSF